MNTDFKALNPNHVWAYFYELTQIPRPTGHTEAVGAYVESFGRSLGLETLRDEVGNVLIRKPATAGMEASKGVILQSHIDMVPEKNKPVSHNFLTDPIKAYIDGEWVKAQDTTLGADNGIGMALAMAVLSDTSIEHGAIEALFTVDEEVGMKGAFGLAPDFLKGRIMINLDSEEEGQLFMGCAGGEDLNVNFTYREDTDIPEGDVAVAIRLVGLKGGHSGVDIHLGRANANRLMIRFLKDAVEKYEACLASINGGSLRNAIPREAFALVTIPEEDADNFFATVAEYQDLFRAEFAGIETEIEFTAEKVDLPETLLPEEIQNALIHAAEGCQNGVISMLHEFPGTVESSSNLAIIASSPGRTEVKFLVRSSSQSRKDWICSSIESVFAMAGTRPERGGAYTGWNPNTESPILKLMKGVYENLYGKTPEMKVIHAGLECGIILGIYPDMDMISIGADVQYPHSPAERLNIASVEKTWNYIKATLKQIKNL